MARRRCRTAGLRATGAVAAVGLGWAFLRRRPGRDQSPPPGVMVPVRGRRRLHVWRSGTGGPAVVVVPALGSWGADWRAVADELQDSMSVYVVDRAGYGWSDPVVWPRSLSRLASDVDAAVSGAGVEGPYVVVGHSLGGLIARLHCARLPPGRVAGLVLVDASHEDQFSARRGGRPLDVLALLAVVVRSTAALLAGRREGDEGWYHLAVAQEILGWLLGGTRRVRDEARNLDGIPVTVITAGARDREHMYESWRRFQDDLAGTLSPDTVHIVAEHCGHLVHDDDPGLIAAAVRDVMAGRGS